ncbi:MAG: ATP-binding protein, partial [Caldimonas sp.]
MRRRASLRQRITVVVMTTTFAALLMSATALLIYELRTYRSAWIADLTTQAELVANSSAAALTFDDAGAARENLALLRLRPQIEAAAVYAANGRLFATYMAPNAAATAIPPAPDASGSHFDGDNLRLFEQVEHNGDRVGTVYLLAHYDVSGRLRDYLAILVAVTAGSLALAAVIFGSLEHALTQPILALAQAARDVVRRRDYRLEVEKTTDDEVGVLVDSFNDMLRDLALEMEQRQKAEDALRVADRRKDEFLATLAHELRNPLAPIVTGLEILKKPTADARAQERARELMTRQLRQMVRLIDDLLDVSRITSNKLELQRETLDLSQIVREAVEVIEPLLHERTHVLKMIVPGEPLWVEGDATRLTQVFVNLLNNAAKYTGRGGRIVVTAATEGNDASVRVADTGVGVEPSQQAGIFEMFMQVDKSLGRDRAGLGVGLSLARRLVELHGGTIVIHSAGLGHGSEFTVRVP